MSPKGFAGLTAAAHSGSCSAPTTVIARLDRATQYSETAVIESRGRGVLDAPVKPGHDGDLGGAGFPRPPAYKRPRICYARRAPQLSTGRRRNVMAKGQ